MPATSEKNLGREVGKRRKLFHLGKITTIFFLIFNTHNFKHIQLLQHFTQFLCTGAITSSKYNYIFKHWVKALHKNTILLFPLSF